MCREHLPASLGSRKGAASRPRPWWLGHTRAIQPGSPGPPEQAGGRGEEGRDQGEGAPPSSPQLPGQRPAGGAHRKPECSCRTVAWIWRGWTPRSGSRTCGKTAERSAPRHLRHLMMAHNFPLSFLSFPWFLPIWFCLSPFHHTIKVLLYTYCLPYWWHSGCFFCFCFCFSGCFLYHLQTIRKQLLALYASHFWVIDQNIIFHWKCLKVL